MLFQRLNRCYHTIVHFNIVDLRSRCQCLELFCMISLQYHFLHNAKIMLALGKSFFLIAKNLYISFRNLTLQEATDDCTFRCLPEHTANAASSYVLVRCNDPSHARWKVRRYSKHVENHLSKETEKRPVSIYSKRTTFRLLKHLQRT